MKNVEKHKIMFLTVIAGRKQQDVLLEFLAESGSQLTNIIYGKGTTKPGYLKNILGLVPEENKVVITCVLTETKANNIMNLLVEKFNFNKPNTGIAFTIPIEKLSF
jgi:hypothetical protein